MRGRRGPSSSSGVRQLSRMSLRKQIIKDVHSESQQTDENTQEDEAAADGDDKDELSASLLPEHSAREQRWKEREDKSTPNEMTEEEMMDLALRLSEQEASVTALRRRQEEEEVMKAIEESMVDQPQPGQASQSQTLLTDASPRLCPRRKLSYSNRKKSAAVDPETNLNSGAGGAGNEKNNRNNKRTRKAGSPLLEMPDLSQKTCSQASPSSSECLSAHPDSPQSSDSTQIDDLQLRKSPVFPSTGGRAEVHVCRLTQDLLDSCRSSGFVLCSQDSWASTQIPAQPKSPTFRESNPTTRPGSIVSSEAVPSPSKSPVFGRNTRRETSPSACKPHASICSSTCENSGFTLSSQDSLTATARPKSPVFLSERLPKKPTEPSPGRSGSPVLDRTGRRQESRSDVQEKSEIPSANREVRNGDGGQVDSFDDASQSSHSDEPKEKPKDWNCSETELTSDMTLVLSDEDEDVTVGGSSSPVFPGERPPHRAESQTASLNHLEADSPETSCSLNPQRCDQSSSNKTPGASPSLCCSSREAVSRTAPPSGEHADGPTVHYYWGVPFCPRGLDPDRYTKVILAQMEVYEKSLKQAQRCLMRKAEWGEAILPQPENSPSPELLTDSPQHHAPQRRGLRLRGQKLREAAESLPAEAEEEEEEERGGKENAEEEEKKDGDDEPVDVDDCEVCPETQLSDVTQDLMKDDRTEVSPQPPPESTDSPEVEMILQEVSPTSDKLLPPQEEEMEVDAPTDENTQPMGSIDSGGQTARQEEVKEDQMDPDVEEVAGRRLQRSESPELDLAIVPQSSEAAVDCPICQTSFPTSQIEMHAAYCDGEAADRRRPGGSHASLKPRRKRTRRVEATPDETNEPSNSGRNQEKCYICQKNIPLREYSRHTELCFQRRPSKTRGNLLSALEQTESRDSDAGPSGSKPAPGDIIDLRDDDEEEEVVSALRISDSPIRSFTSISEATDCLIDFKKQRRAAKPSQRRR
ncbi:BRCA1-A complex subunit RAP80 isoform X2 [Amphiprion ocellaris]|uniref:BRCA1-A complex subunit RAP80 n=1 Tax=Amphiprion ocellaris TaxID=80972 RepID=A0AAQ5XKN1_AMPOC|nr:BRCA1-A complex subunit RAP80 isoform X2 [Amphiprion ocellaris]